MDHHLLSTMENEQALDFTSSTRQYSRDRSIEPPILDLSCKKQNSSSCSLSPVSIEGTSNPPSNDNAKGSNSPLYNDNHYDETETKSPHEVRNFMVTPPSEIDSPRKPKKENNTSTSINVLTTNETFKHDYTTQSTTVAPLSIVKSDILSSRTFAQNGDESPTNQQLPVSTTTATSSNGYEVTCSSIQNMEGTKKSAPRPFKAYPKDPLTMSVGSDELLYDQTSTEAYSEFRKRMLDSVRRTNDGTNIKMRRVSKSPGLPTSTIMDEKDAAYWERRRKNNEAAKRSRDARRAKEDEIAIRAAFLEQENLKLKYELVALRNETAKLRCMIYTN